MGYVGSKSTHGMYSDAELKSALLFFFILFNPLFLLSWPFTWVELNTRLILNLNLKKWYSYVVMPADTSENLGLEWIKVTNTKQKWTA